MKKILFAVLALMLALPAVAQDKPLRLGVAGVSHGHLWEVARRVGRGDFEVVGVAEPNAQYRASNSLVGKVPADRFYADLATMLDATKPEVVVAYGSIYDHLSVVEACAPRHIDVMVEKPLATTVKQAKKIEALAKKYGIKVLTNYETSWYTTNHHAKTLVDRGAIGAVRRMNVYDGHEGPKEIGCDDKFLSWLTDPVLNGGGAIVDFGCYGANLATWFFGNQRPVSVYAITKQHKPAVYPKVDDDATIVLEYPGATVQIMASWNWPVGRKDMYVYGDKGYIYQKTPTTMATRIGDKESGEFEAPAMAAVDSDSFYYLKAVVRGDIVVKPTDLASLENNMIVVQILEAARKSARSGKVVKP